MLVQYDKKKCDEWIEQFKDDELIFYYLYHLTTGYYIHMSDRDVIDEYQAMSLWEKQYILYQLAPIAEKLITTEAAKLSERARIEEPL